MPTLRSFLRWFATFGIDMGNPAADSVNVGNEWYAQGSFDNAIAEYSEAIRLDPNFAGAYHNRGACWCAKKEFDKAIEDFSAALRIDPNLAMAFGGRGRAWHDLQKFELALSDFDEAIRLDPHDPLNYANRGYVWHVKQEYDEAIDDYSEAIRLDSSLAWAYSCRGSARLTKLEQGRASPRADQLDRPAIDAPPGSNARLGYDLAIEDFNAAIRIEPNNAENYYARAHVWRALDDNDQAIDDFTEAIRREPNFANALVSRGHAWREKQQYEKAIDDFDEAIRIAPGEPWAFNGLAWLLGSALDEKFRDGQRAIKVAHQAMMLEPTKTAWTMDTLAVAFAEAGDFETAIRWQELALQDPPRAFEAEMRERLELYRKGQPYRQQKKGPMETQFMYLKGNP